VPKRWASPDVRRRPPRQAIGLAASAVPDSAADLPWQWDARAVGADRERTWRTLFGRVCRQASTRGGRVSDGARRRSAARAAGIVHSAVVEAQGKRESVATRKASQLALEVLAEAVPERIGGSADLTGSNLTRWSRAVAMRAGSEFVPGRHINYGVREIRDERDRQRHGAARRPDPVLRDIPDVFRLLAQRAANGGADEESARFSSSRTTRSVWARMGQPTRRSSTRRVCA